MPGLECVQFKQTALNAICVCAGKKQTLLRFSPSLHGELYIQFDQRLYFADISQYHAVNCFFGAQYESQKLRYEGSEYRTIAFS